MITHNLEAAAIADRILQVRDGQILSDTLTEYAAPAAGGAAPVVPPPLAGNQISL
jgi:hypothetical protein